MYWSKNCEISQTQHFTVFVVLKLEACYYCTLWWPVCRLLNVLCVSEVPDEAERSFAAGWSCAGPHTCSALSVISTCSCTQTFTLHGARLLSPVPVH